MDIVCFSANVRQCNIAYSLEHIEPCFQLDPLEFIITFSSSCRPAYIYVSGWFVCADGN